MARQGCVLETSPCTVCIQDGVGARRRRQSCPQSGAANKMMVLVPSCETSVSLIAKESYLWAVF